MTSALALAIFEAVEGLIATLTKAEREEALARAQAAIDQGELPDLASKWEAAKLAARSGLKTASFTCRCGTVGPGAHDATGDFVIPPADWIVFLREGFGGASIVAACSPACAG